MRGRWLRGPDPVRVFRLFRQPLGHCSGGTLRQQNPHQRGGDGVMSQGSEKES